MENQQCLVLIKPDGVQKNLSGKIISRFEDMGLKVVGVKMLHADEVLAEQHYPITEEWAKAVFEKTKASYEKRGKKLQTNSHTELAKSIQRRNINLITSHPIIAMVLEGKNSIELVRKMVGNTEPKQALPGTIRGDFAPNESYELADLEKRSLNNLVHASDSAENAKREITLWFNEEELHYKNKQKFI